MITEVGKHDIRSLSLDDLRHLVEEWGEPTFRARQIYQWLWEKGAEDFGAMHNLPKSLRERLAIGYAITPIEEEIRQYSDDGTIKIRWVLHDGHKIESVLIPVVTDNRYTVCVSSQVGCSLSCTFCATGKMKRERNLDAAEIVDQVRKVQEICLSKFGHPLTNIVYMGMGEPLLAFKPLMASIERISAPDGLGFSPKRITVSTAGIAKMIHRLADEKVRFNLALSLHAADDEKRNVIMPINEQNNLAVLIDALKHFYRKTRNRISYEYIAFKNFNISNQDADKLAALCKSFPVRVNIIEFNPVEGVSLSKADEEQVDAFARRLRDQGIMVTLRRSRGKDIDAACGQLANKE